MQNSFKVTLLHQEWVVGGWIVLLQNQEMAGSRNGGRAFGAGGPGGALALPTRGPGLRPWLPRASAGPPATLLAAALVALSCARPRQGRHQPSPSIRAAACAPGSFWISWCSADPGYDRLVPNQQAGRQVCGRTAGFGTCTHCTLHTMHTAQPAPHVPEHTGFRSRGTGDQRLVVQLSDPMFPSRGQQNQFKTGVS